MADEFCSRVCLNCFVRALYLLFGVTLLVRAIVFSINIAFVYWLVYVILYLLVCYLLDTNLLLVVCVLLIYLFSLTLVVGSYCVGSI